MTKLRDYIYYEEPAGVIYCGDCLQIIPLLEKDSFDLVVTDPPYDLDINKSAGGITERESVKVYKAILNEKFGNGFDIDRLIKIIDPKMTTFNGYFWCSKRQISTYLNFAESVGYNYDLLTWHKNNPPPLTCNNLLPDTEYGMFIRKPGAVFINGLRKDTYTKFWITPRQTTNGHPTPKPLKIFSCHILISSRQGATILDPFFGSGTSLIAAANHGRGFIGIEISEKYCELAVMKLAQGDIFKNNLHSK